MRKAKIVATLGPASRTAEMLDSARDEAAARFPFEHTERHLARGRRHVAPRRGRRRGDLARLRAKWRDRFLAQRHGRRAGARRLERDRVRTRCRVQHRREPFEDRLPLRAIDECLLRRQVEDREALPTQRT